MTLPTFLGIGAQKAGTTWLHYHLKRHPEIWLPPVKELHYFDRAPGYRSTHHAARFLGRTRWARAYARRLRDTAIALQRREWDGLVWLLHNALRRYDDAWYLSIFRQAPSRRAAGEITPSYALLDAADVQHIHSLLPQLKVIFIMRNPVDRAWSHIRFAGLGKASLTTQIQFVESPEQALRSDYLRTITIWQSVFGRDQLYLGYFDHIVARPQPMLRELCDFLGVDSRLPDLDGSLRQPIHVTGDQSGMPPALAAHLAQKYLPQIEALACRFDGPPARWMEQVAAQARRVEGSLQYAD